MLFDLFREELVLCGVKPGERVGILSEDLIRRDYAVAFAAAAEDLGADAVHVNIAKRPGSFFGPGNSLRGRQAAIDALKATDLVIDLVGLLWSAEQDEITATGTRMLLVLEPPSVLARLRTSREVRARVETAVKMLEGAKELRVTSPGGTDVTYCIGNMRTIGQYGYTDEPGRWDAWSGSFVWTGGDEDGVNGRVVIDAGDLHLEVVERVGVADHVGERPADPHEPVHRQHQHQADHRNRRDRRQRRCEDYQCGAGDAVGALGSDQRHQ